MLRSEAESPPAECALFIPSEGDEGGYRTTAGTALARLEAAGVTEIAIDAATAALRWTAHRFARGVAVRQMLLELGPAELFDGHVFHGEGYEGLVLDLCAIAESIGLAHAPVTMQSIALASLLRRVPADAEVTLVSANASTGNSTSSREIRALIHALRSLAGDPFDEGAEAPIRRVDDLLEALLEKGLSHEGFSRIQHSLTLPPPPSAGPLSEPEAWAIELGLGKGDHAALTGALVRIEELEKSRGKRPVTVYLRSRAALLLGAEPPRMIAERVESLCATQAFPELSLLAAQAWLAAGEPDRAVPFARAVLLSTQSTRTTRERADDILASSPSSSRSSYHGNDRVDRSEAVMSPLDRGWEDPHSVPSLHIANKTRASQRIAAAKERPSSRFALALPRKPSRLTVPRPTLSRPPPPPISVPSVYSEAPPDRSRRTRVWNSAAAPPRPPSINVIAAETEPMVPCAPVITVEGHASPEVPAPPPPRPNPDQTEKMEASVSTPLALVTQRRVPTAADARQTPSGPVPSLNNRPTPSGPTRSPSSPAGTMRGASMPAYQSDPPPVVQAPRPQRLPRLTPPPPELAETLSLPPGLHGQIAPLEGELPKTSLEARILFTHMARRLGREYREKHQIRLSTTVESIEQIQAVLQDRFPDGTIRTREEHLFVRRHGAFLSEILARTLEAEWVDIAPTEIGYWAMVVPAKTRVWPFGRVLRLLSRGHRERDLVSYYLELKNRALRDRE
ncbi:hypothetical protein LZC95_13025 [Pendulispora brunnea]|uniref:Uncharacterized protein n=1 Tax=Pendulispora brunnea TaxID=2905690 RepID=A0ABZ2KGR9_9BACT